MGKIYVYAGDETDFTTTGVAGALIPTKCEHEEIAGGVSAISLEHPVDAMGKWAYIKCGSIIKADIPVRTTPEIDAGQVISTVETWIVKATATKAQRTIYTTESGNKKIKIAPVGAKLYVVRKGNARYKCKLQSGRYGWIAIEAVEYSTVEALPSTPTETWVVKSGATKTQRTVFNSLNGSGVIKIIKAGAMLTVVEKSSPRYKLRLLDGRNGYILPDGIEFVSSQTLPPSSDAIDDIVPAWKIGAQLFRVQSVEMDTKNNIVRVYAPHISYDLSGNVTRFKSQTALTAVQALSGIFANCDFSHEFSAYTDIGDTRTGVDWCDISPIQAMLDPDIGFCKIWSAELVRDNYDLYFLRRAGRNRGVRIEYGKNLLGVTMEISQETVVTAIKPVGETKKGERLYLTDDPTSSENYIYSGMDGEYAAVKGMVLQCDDCAVGSNGVTLDLARARMREQAQRMFDEEDIDLPDVTLTVDFVALGDTIEYAQYKNLERLYIYDEVPVVDKTHGIEVLTDVKRMVWDCINDRAIEIELGNVREGVDTIYSWQIPGLEGDKLRPGTVPGGALEEGAISEDKLREELQEKLQNAYDNIDSAQELIDSTREWLTQVESAVTNAEGDIAALEIAASEIRAGLTDAEGDIAALSLRADGIQTALTNAQGDISTLKQSATQMSSTIQSMQGEISSISQQASSISTTVATLNGQVQSLIEQTAEKVAITLKDDSISSLFYMKISKRNEYENQYGLEMYYNGALGGLYILSDENNMKSLTLTSENNLYLESNKSVSLNSGQKYIKIGTTLDNTNTNVYTNTSILPYGYTIGDTRPQLGGGSNTARWNYIYLVHSPNVSSDARKKCEIEDISGEFVDYLRPRKYRLRENPQKIHFGFIAQEVDFALKKLEITNAALLDDENPDNLALIYEEIIALLVAKIQSLEKRVKIIEGKLKVN